MKKNLSFYLFLLAICATKVQAQVAVTATQGTLTGNYSTIGQAFALVNNGTHKGVITMVISASITELAPVFIDSSGNASGSSYTSISVSPQVGVAVTISGSATGDFIRLNGADNVIFNGINTGGTYLTIVNTSTAAGGSTLYLLNDATKNYFINMTIRGFAPTATTPLSGTVFLGTGLVTGNDGNVFLRSTIDGSGSANCTFFSNGSTTSPTIENSNDSIANCNIIDFFSNTVTPYGLLLNAGNTNWSITGNSLYQTVSTRTCTLQTSSLYVTISPSYTGDAHEVIGNFIGGSGPNATGLVTYNAAAVAYGFIGLNIFTGGPGNIIQNNTIQNVTVNWALAGGSFANNAISALISGFDGTITITGNTAKNLTFYNSLGSALGGAISANGRVLSASVVQKPTFAITNNIIDNIVYNSGGTGAAQFYGIRLEASSGGGLSTATTASNPYFIVTGNSITNLSSTVGGASGWVRGIGNVLTNGTSPTPTSTCALIPKALIQNNTINNLACNGSLASYSTNTTVGIQYSGLGNTSAFTIDNIDIVGNTIYNLSATNTADLANSVAGIIGTNGLYNITRNKIYGLTLPVNGTAVPIVAAINLRAAFSTSLVANNFVSIGNNVNASFFGILNNFSASGTINAYHNTIYIGGTVVSGANNSACLHRGNEIFTSASIIATAFDVRNNIFVNQRIGGTGAHFALSAYSTGTLTSNYNNLNVATATNTAYYGGTAYTLAGYQTAASADANSKAITVALTNIATGDLHLTGASNGDGNLKSVPLPSVPKDYDDQTRSLVNAYMGADEAPIVLPLQLIAFNGQLKNNNALLYWTTTAEVNSDKFDVEKSTNGTTWTTIQTVAAKGSIVKNEYQIEDAGIAGKVFYRLKIVDKDGKYTYSSVVSLEVNNKAAFVLNQNYPNPVKIITQLSYQINTDAKVVIQLLTNDGKTIAILVNQNQVSGSYNVTIDASKYGLSTGNYLCKMIVLDTNNKPIFNVTKTMIVVK